MQSRGVQGKIAAVSLYLQNLQFRAVVNSVKIRILMKQYEVILYAYCGDNAIDRFPYRFAGFPAFSVYFGGCQICGDALRRIDGKIEEVVFDGLKIGIGGDSLEDFQNDYFSQANIFFVLNQPVQHPAVGGL